MTLPKEPGRFQLDLGFELEEVGPSRVSGHIVITEGHHTPFGVAHGGVFTTLVEWSGSVGASAAVADRGEYAVGTHNATDFLRPVVAGRVDVVATPVFQGRVQQLWEVQLTRHDDRKLVAEGRLRLQNVPRPTE
jgi:1,4-dihydroxy-2-naphthoyl-CoA hydrolase